MVAGLATENHIFGSTLESTLETCSQENIMKIK